MLTLNVILNNRPQLNVQSSTLRVLVC